MIVFRLSQVFCLVALLSLCHLGTSRLEKAYGRPSVLKHRIAVPNKASSVNIPYRRVFINPSTSAPYTLDDYSYLTSEPQHPLSTTDVAYLPVVQLGDKPCGGYHRQTGCRNKTIQDVRCPHTGNGNLVGRIALLGDWGLSKTQCEESVAALHAKYRETSVKSKTPFFTVLAGDNAYWRGTCSDHYESFGASAVKDSFDFLAAAQSCVEPPSLPSYFMTEKVLKRRIKRNAVHKAPAQEGFAPFSDSIGFGKGQYRGVMAPLRSVPFHSTNIPIYLLNKGLPSPFVLDESIPRVVQWIQRVEYIRAVLTRQAIPALRVYDVEERAPVIFTGYSDEEALEYILWQFPQVGSYEEFLKDTKKNSPRARFDPNTGYKTHPGMFVDVNEKGKVVHSHGFHAAVSASLLGVDAIDQSGGYLSTFLTQINQVQARTWIDQEDFHTNMPSLFPTPGNHDYDMLYSVRNDLPYTQYFRYLDLLPPGGAMHNGQFYQVQLRSKNHPVLGLFSISSTIGGHNHKIDSYAGKQQLSWVRDALRKSPAKMNIVVFHHPPQTSNINGGQYQYMNVPWREWGASVVVTGHQHIYERVQPDPKEAMYFVNGLGGHNWVYGIHDCEHVQGSKFQFNQAHGQLVADQYQPVDLKKNNLGSNTPQPSLTSTIHIGNTQNQDNALEDNIHQRGGSFVASGPNAWELSMCFVSTRDGGTVEDQVSIFG